MPGELSIRPAQREDVPVIIKFIRALAEYEKLSHLVEIDEDLLRQHLFGDKPAAEAVIAWQDAQPVGYALYFTTFSTFVGRPGIWLEDIFVVPAARGGGIGKALMRHVAGIATARGCGRLEWSVLDWNQPAIDFYKRLGAQMLPDWRICRISPDDIANG